MTNIEGMKRNCRIWSFVLIGSAFVAAVITVWCLIMGKPIIGEMEGAEFTWGIIAMAVVAAGCAAQAVIGLLMAKGHDTGRLCPIFGLLVFVGVLVGLDRMLGNGHVEFIMFFVIILPSIAVDDYSRRFRKLKER